MSILSHAALGLINEPNSHASGAPNESDEDACPRLRPRRNQLACNLKAIKISGLKQKPVNLPTRRLILLLNNPVLEITAFNFTCQSGCERKAVGSKAWNYSAW